MSEHACEGFEIAIEMRRHGAADAEASARLDRHLAGCAGCRAFERLGEQVQGGLQTAARQAEVATDLDALRARGRRALSSWWADVGTLYAFFALLAAARIAAHVTGVRPFGADWFLDLLAFVLPLIGVLFNRRRTRREFEEASSAEFLFFLLRLHAKRRLWTTLFIGGILLALPVCVAPAWLRTGLQTPRDWLDATSALCMASLAVFVLVTRVPALRRELAELPPTALDEHAALWGYIG